MKIILKADVKGLGKKGEALEVAEGYGRNFLIPRDLAFEASPAAIKQAELEKQAQIKKEAKDEEKAKELARSMKDKVVTIKTKGGDTGKLYGSITSKDVTDAINKSLNMKLDKKKVELDEPIRALGEYSITIRLHPGVATEMKVVVELE